MVVVLVAAGCSPEPSDATWPGSPVEPGSVATPVGSDMPEATSKVPEDELEPVTAGAGPLFLRAMDAAELTDDLDSVFLGVGASLWSAVSPSGERLAAAGTIPRP